MGVSDAVSIPPAMAPIRNDSAIHAQKCDCFRSSLIPGSYLGEAGEGMRSESVCVNATFPAFLPPG